MDGTTEVARRLAQRLDSFPWRKAGRIAEHVRALRAPTFPPALSFEAVVAGLDAAASVPQLELALESALRGGALESARLLGQRLHGRLAEGSASARAYELLLSTLLMGGEREAATALATAHIERLSTRSGGAALLELLKLAELPMWLPDGSANAFGVWRRITEGRLAAHELALELLHEQGAWLRAPELLLILFASLRESDPVLASSFLNSLLAIHGLPPCSFDEHRSSLTLQALRFAPLKRVAGPLVSVLVPAHNAADSIGYALESLLAQGYADLEILVGDDASDDDTPSVLRGFAQSPQVRLFRSTRRQGAYNMRNALATKARGELLTFHDADDFALPTRIERQVAALAPRSKVACVANFLRVTPDFNPVFFKDHKAIRLCQVSLMLKRSAFAAVGPFRSARVGADAELFSDLVAHFGGAAIGRIRAPLLFGRWSAQSATRSLGTEALEDGYRSVARRTYSEHVFWKRVPGHGRTDAEIDEALRTSENFVEPARIEALD